MAMTPTLSHLLEWLADAGVSDDTLTDLRAYAADDQAREVERARANEHVVAGTHPTATLDQRMMMSSRKIKWYRDRRSQKTAVCLHHTAVRGGFGAPHSLIERVRANRLALPKIVHWPSPPPDEDAVARLFAIAARYRGEVGEGVPYHAIITASGAVVLNLPFEMISWHGNGANTTSLGVAWDGSSQHERPRDTSATIEALCQIVECARAEGHPISAMTCHSQWTCKPYDPGPAFVEDIAAPVASRLGLHLDRAFYRATGSRLQEAP